VTIVVDASVALAWVHGDERTDAVEMIFRRIGMTGAVVPVVWPLEVANALTMAVRRGSTSPALRDHALSDLTEVPIRIDDETNAHAWTATIKLADLHGLTVYDAAYLELAQRRRLPLATLDTALKRAANAVSVQVLP
jgi:predicted nucleic acid-binding protein